MRLTILYVTGFAQPGGGVVSVLAFYSGGPSSRLGLGGEALILLYPLEVRRQSNSMPATLMGRSRMIYDIDGYVKKKKNWWDIT